MTMNQLVPVPRRSSRLAALAGARDGCGASRQSHKGPTIGRYQVVFDSSPSKESTDREQFSLRIPTVDLIPASNWASVGYDHETADRYEMLAGNLNGIVEFLQKSCPLSPHDYGISLTVTAERVIRARDLKKVLPHHEWMVQYWETFAAALQSYHVDYHSFFLGFVSMEIDSSVLRMLTPAIKAQKLTSLLFSGNKLRRNELILLSNIIENTPTLEALSICRNNIGRQKDDVLCQLSAVIRYHPRLQRLALVSCGIQDNDVLLSCIKNRHLRNVDLGFNRISSKGAYFIAKFLAKTKSGTTCLTSLCLQGNKINDDDALVIASSLRKNSTLKSLHLEHNDMSDKGRCFLFKSLYDISSLNGVSDSNHTCMVTVGDTSDMLNWENGETCDTLECVNNKDVPKLHGRRCKILSTLFRGPSDGYSSLSYLEDVPIELAPDVMGQIFQHSVLFGTRSAHTLVFEFLRATPSIFVANSAMVTPTSDVVVITRKKRKYN